MPKPSADGQRKIIINLVNRPHLLTVIERLRAKTGMRSAVDIVSMALTQFDARLPEQRDAQDAIPLSSEVTLTGRAR